MKLLVLALAIVGSLLTRLQPRAAAADHAGTVVRKHPCDFEASDLRLCGWQENADRLGPEREEGLTAASAAPHGDIAPPVDANPGTSEGTYFYLYYPSVLTVQTLSFPSFSYICELSFAFYSNMTELEVVRFNYDHRTVFRNFSLPPYSWQRVQLNFNTSELTTDDALIFEVSGYDFGEADPEGPEGSFLYIALDDVNITFCLPCDFDLLSEEEPDNLVLHVPSNDVVEVILDEDTSFVLSASSPICTDSKLEFVFLIESVEPQHMAPVFSLDGGSGLFSVMGTSPHLDANGTTGTVNVSVHILGSNYTHTKMPYKAMASLSFHQPRTITVSSPAAISLRPGVSFRYEVNATSEISPGGMLQYSNLATLPAELLDQISLDIENLDTPIVSGNISFFYLPAEVEFPSFSVRVGNEYERYVVHTVQLVFEQSPPVFSRTVYSFTVEEEVPSSALGVIKVIDLNKDQLSQLTYPNEEILLSGGAQSSLTYYASYTVLLLESLDYEKEQRKEFHIVARDHVDPSLSSTATVVVSVLPKNEYNPTISPPNFSEEISDFLPIGDIVAEFVSTDLDGGKDGEIEFAISSGNDGLFFKISTMFNKATNETIGSVMIDHSPIYPQKYVLTIVASDQTADEQMRRSSEATLTITVLASQTVDCSESQYGPPTVVEGLPHTHTEPIHSDVTITCHFDASPVTLLIEWSFLPFGSLTWLTVLTTTGNSRYAINVAEQSLTITNLTLSDGGVYQCNATNQCGSEDDQTILFVIDRPDAPQDVAISEPPRPTSVGVTWSHPSVGNNPFQRPVDSYRIQVMESGLASSNGTTTTTSDGDAFVTVVDGLSGETNSTLVTGLTPATAYTLRVVAVNSVGETPSENVVTFATLESVPKLAFFLVSSLANYSIAVQWELEYDGGSPVISFIIDITDVTAAATQQGGESNGRKRRGHSGSGSAHSYTVDVDSEQLTTEALPSGRSYEVSAHLQSGYGENHYTTLVFVGLTDEVSCSIEAGTCEWELDSGHVVSAQDAGSTSGPSLDASGSSTGSYVFAQFTASDGNTSIPLMTYYSAQLFCGISFSYQAHATTLRLVTSSTDTPPLFSSSSAPLGETGGTGEGTSSQTGQTGEWWSKYSLGVGRYVPSASNEYVQFVAESSGEAGGWVAVDNVGVHFCLPCDLHALASSTDNFYLSHVNFTEVFLEQTQKITVEARLVECETAVIDFNIVKVIPQELESYFAIEEREGRRGEITVHPIPSDAAEPDTEGLVEVEVGVVGSEYSPQVAGSWVVARIALIDFIVLKLIDGCSFASQCDFEGPCSEWTLQDSVARITNSSGQPELDSNAQGSYIYGHSTTPDSSNNNNPTPVLSTVIENKNFCAVSFSYAVSPSVELQVLVEGVGLVWSSLVNTAESDSDSSDTTTTATAAAASWTRDTAILELESAQNVSSRRLSFEVDYAAVEAFGEAGMEDGSVGSSYFGLDDIVLHPCIDCQLPECSCSYCFPGKYFSVKEDKCVSCPRGHYCPSWHSLPQPCPPGTFSPETDKPSLSYCLPVVPVIVLVGVAAGEGLLVLILVTCSLICCCFCSKKKKVQKQKRKERQVLLNSLWQSEATEQSSLYGTPSSTVGKGGRSARSPLTFQNDAFEGEEDPYATTGRAGGGGGGGGGTSQEETESIVQEVHVDFNFPLALARGGPGINNSADEENDGREGDKVDLIELDNHNASDHTWSYPSGSRGGRHTNTSKM